MPTTSTPTHCPYCALQCGMALSPLPTGGVEVVERPDFPVNRGALCGKGRTAPAVLSSRVRLTSPLVRSGGSLVPATWEEALDRIAGELGRVRSEHGADALGVFGGGGLTNEKAYTLGKFARVVLGTSQIDYNGRFCMSSAAAAGIKAFGLDRGLPFPLEDIPRTGCVILVGSNLAETMPPSLRFFNELRENGGTLIVIDPRRTKTAEQADLHLAPRPGTDLALALGLLHLIVAEGRVDEEYVRERTTGWEDARAAAMAHWPEYVERITGVSVPQLRETVRLFCEPEAAMVLTARGPEQQSKGTDTVGAWINLCLATGRAGRPLSGYGCLTGQGNGQGGREHGQKADQLPGYRKLDDPAARRHVAEVWGVDPDSLPGPGRSAYELLDALGSDVRSLLLMGSNPVVSAPHAAHIEERVRSLEFLAVCDVVLSETAALADVVLPVTQWAEETGTTTSLEGRVLLRRQAITAPEGVRSDLEVLHELAARLGVEKGFPTDPEEVFEELRRASAGGVADYSGITYARLMEASGAGVFWPCPAETDTKTQGEAEDGDRAGAGDDAVAGDRAAAEGDAPTARDEEGDRRRLGAAAGSDTGAGDRAAAGGEAGAGSTGKGEGGEGGEGGQQRQRRTAAGTPRLFLDRFATEDGRARFVPVSHRPNAEEPDDDYPVLLTTGRVVSQYQSGAQTRRVDELNAAAPGPFVELHPRLAARLGASEGDPLAVVSRRGRAVAPARITTGIRPDTVFMPFHWPGEGRANTLTNPALDPTSRMPEFKVCAVRVEIAG
ncbi:molybdopterin oxidoreductase family protein [Streptomyces zaehneri]|uniref:molybdopterin oxidoreductase family protein n=1 Tax=Streptomyces zaehneri TaxID=3051180 RepID=UPI0028D12631|nr:molybdopterin oxidoreductase family protein [Streptomyces sp. DSM 40713]